MEEFVYQRAPVRVLEALTCRIRSDSVLGCGIVSQQRLCIDYVAADELLSDFEHCRATGLPFKEDPPLGKPSRETGNDTQRNEKRK